MNTIEHNIEQYFALSRERYEIRINRLAGYPKPWTTDKVFQNNRFCNVFREDDRTTTWFRENIRDPLNKTEYIHPGLILLGITAFRWFNRIETWDTILASQRGLENILADWDSDWIRGEIADHVTPPYVTGAYIIKTPDGKNKVDGVLWCLDQFVNLVRSRKFDAILTGDSTHEAAQKLLVTAPYLGSFMAYQIIADARYTCLLDKAPDINSWAQPGPGSSRGISRVFHNDPTYLKYGSVNDEKEVVRLMRELLEASRDRYYWPQEYPEWEMQVVQNWCCEVDKYHRATEGGKMKRKYNAN